MARGSAVFHLALRSVANRKTTVGLTLFSIAVSVALLVGVERIRLEARESFANTISGTDLIVGARSGPVQLLLFSVFRIGDATNSISWKSYQTIAASPLVKWSIPLSLGDSHRGFRVLGTTADYFQHFRFARTRSLDFDQGGPFEELYQAVIGADVARELGYELDTPITVSHGLGATSFANHDDTPFRVSGILKKTGTPVDRTVHLSLSAIEAIHIGWESGVPIPGAQSDHDRAMEPEVITAFLLGLENRVDTLRLQRAINDYPDEALLAILPGVALQQLWGLVGIAEMALFAISLFVVVAGLLGMLATILTSLSERRREMAILRSVGARPGHIFALLLLEAGLVAFSGAALGVVFVSLLLFLGRATIESSLGVFIGFPWPGTYELVVLGGVVTAALLLAIWPAWRAYRNSLADGLTVMV